MQLHNFEDICGEDFQIAIWNFITASDILHFKEILKNVLFFKSFIHRTNFIYR